MSLRAKIDSLENELGKLKTEHLSCNVEHRRLERKFEVKNDELEDLKRELGFSKDAEAKAIKRYKRALEYNIEVEAEVAELKTRFEQERGQLLGQLSHLKEKLTGESGNLKADTACKSNFNDVQCSSNSRKRKEFAKPIVLSEGEIVGENGGACNQKRESPADIQKSGSGDVSGDAINHNDDSSNDASDHEQEQTNIQINVRTVTGETISMSVKPSLTIDNLKSKIQDKKGIPAQNQLLVFARKQLDDSRIPTQYKLLKDSLTLAHYNIDDETIIRLAISFP